MGALKITEFGAPILRDQAQNVLPKDIESAKYKKLIMEMKNLLLTKKLGIGLAAPQVGNNKRLFIVTIRPSKYRPDTEPFDLVAFNPVINETIGRRKQMYEGCISGGPGKAGLFAKVPRYPKIRLSYTDELGKHHENTFTGLAAHVIQH